MKRKNICFKLIIWNYLDEIFLYICVCFIFVKLNIFIYLAGHPEKFLVLPTLFIYARFYQISRYQSHNTEHKVREGTKQNTGMKPWVKRQLAFVV